MKTIVKQQTVTKKQNLLYKKLFLSALLTTFSVFQTFASETDLTAKITTWKNSIKNVLDTGVGAFAIVGGFIVFLQYMQGNDQAQKNFVKFVIGLAIFGLVNLIAGVFIGDPTAVDTTGGTP